MQKSFPYIIITVLIIILFFKDCSKKTDKSQVIKTPAIEAVFKPIQPIHIPVNTEIIQNLSRQKTSNEIIKVYITENDSLLKVYQNENDSLKKELLFKKAIHLNSFSTKFEDDNLVLNINGIVQGEVQEITPSYIIKPKEIEVKQKEVKFRLLAGFEVGNDILFDKPLLKGNIGFQNAKGNILTASYDSEKRITIGYAIPLITIKR